MKKQITEAVKMSALGPAEETQPGWWSQPDPNVLCIYLKEDIPTVPLWGWIMGFARFCFYFCDLGTFVIIISVVSIACRQSYLHTVSACSEIMPCLGMWDQRSH